MFEQQDFEHWDILLERSWQIRQGQSPGVMKKSQCHPLGSFKPPENIVSHGGSSSNMEISTVMRVPQQLDAENFMENPI